eukprot:TRINITY_DN62903_c0_g1_i1.p1 TRINITY_DN62903_c0_g1~~TRINITY_DN62903_c0_g1_i1.p1  ORF type:complete len:346 (-),score=56.54 TRINITY_DN62903_c0_g1_i1:283-1320(-)
MASFEDLTCTEVLLPAVSFCDALSLVAVRAGSSGFAKGVPQTSPVWTGLLRLSGAKLAEAQQSDMAKALRLSHAIARIRPRLPRDTALDACLEEQEGGQRHRFVVSGARGSGVSTLVRMMWQGPAPADQAAPVGPQIDMEVYSVRVDCDGVRVKASLVDKRSTAISTPLSASLYRGHTSAAFLFDAGRLEQTLAEAVWCIEDLRETVGEDKFHAMRKLLVCHKAELLLVEGETRLSMASASCLPTKCWELLETFGMHLVLTSSESQESADMLLALAAEQWPQREPVAVGGKEMPVAPHADDPEHTFMSVGTRTRRAPPVPLTLLEELAERRRLSVGRAPPAPSAE